ncbi:MAG TPA: DUF4145 domain-containing protein [Oculatellaceae cyanobacterium]
MKGTKDEVFECSQCGVPTQHTLVHGSENGFKFKVGVKLTKAKGGYAITDFPPASAIVNNLPTRYPGIPIPELESNDGKEILCEVQRGHLLYRCVVCRQETYFLVQYQKKSQGSGHFELSYRIMHRYPKKLFGVHEALPPSIQTYVLECERCMDVRAFNAVGMVARLTVDEIARSFSAIGKDLFQRLEQLKTAGILNEEIIAMAHDVRQAGRNGAHAEWSDITEEQAKNTMYALQEILRELYITPFERDQRKIKDLNRKK